MQTQHPQRSALTAAILLLACALLACACGSTSDDTSLLDTCAAQLETSTYAYDAQGQRAEVERRLMNQQVERKTYDAGRIAGYTLRSADGADLVTATWTYDAQQPTQLTALSVSDRRPERSSDWSMAFTYDAQGRLAAWTSQGLITDALSERLGASAGVDALILGVGPALIDGLDLKQAEAAPKAPLKGASARYRYDDQGRFIESAWDYNGDGVTDATRRDRYEGVADSDDSVLITDLLYDADAQAVAVTITQRRDPNGALVTLTAQLLVQLTEQGDWTTAPLAQPITSYKQWTRGAGQVAGAAYEVGEVLSVAGSAPYRVRARQFDAQDRVIFDADYDDAQAITDQTWIEHTDQARIERRDRDANGAFDQLSTYRYDAADGRILDVKIEETSASCAPGLGATP
jgi:YD repeat-containing protein